MVRLMGLEPIRSTPHAPQTCASANSATAADPKSFARLFAVEQRVALRTRMNYYTQIFPFVKSFLKKRQKTFLYRFCQAIAVGQQRQVRLDFEQILTKTAAGAVRTDCAFSFADADTRIGNDRRVLAVCTDFFELFRLTAHIGCLLAFLLCVVYHIFNGLSRRQARSSSQSA